MNRQFLGGSRATRDQVGQAQFGRGLDRACRHVAGDQVCQRFAGLAHSHGVSSVMAGHDNTNGSRNRL
jgi:hypothetical protein